MEIKKLSATISGSGNFLIYGESGTGKTHSLSTLPIKKTLIISIERGLRTLQDICPDTDVAEIDTIQDMRDVFEMLEGYDCVAIDSISTVADMALKEAKEGTKDGRQAYMAMADTIYAIVESFNKIPQTVIYLCRAGRVNSEEAGLFNYSFCPELPGKKFAQMLPFLFDYVWPLRVKQADEEVSRRFQTNMDGSGGYMCKSRSERLEIFEEINFVELFKKLNKGN